MSDYIGRDSITRAFQETDPDLFTEYDEHYGVESGYSHEAVESIIADLPTADVVEVRHGRWIELSRSSKCSECEFETGRYEPPRRYCPECGARMDGEETPTCHDGVCDIPGITGQEAVE